MDLAEQLERLAPFGQGNPDPRLIVPSARVRTVRPLGQEGKHSRFDLESGAGRAQGVAFGINGALESRQDQSLDLSVRVEVDRWNGAVQPRVVLRELYPLAESGRRSRGDRLRRGRLPVLRLGVVGAAGAPRSPAPPSPSRRPSVAAPRRVRRARSSIAAAARRWPRSRSSSRAASRCSRSAWTRAAAAPWPTRQPTLAGSAPGSRSSPAPAAETTPSRPRSRPTGAGPRAGRLGRAGAASRRGRALRARRPGRSAAVRAARRAGPGGARLPAPRLGAARGRPGRALPGARVGAARARSSRSGGCSPRRAVRPAGEQLRSLLAGPSDFPRTPEVAGRSRGRARRARAVRVEARSRRSLAAGLILGEDGAGAIAGLRGLRRPARGGQAIPAKQSTEQLKDGDRRGHLRVGEPPKRTSAPRADAITRELTAEQRALLGDLFAVIEEHKAELAEPIEREEIERAFAFACESHAGQERKSGEDFITHPLGVARICAGLRLDTATLCAALLHDTVEDTSASLEQVRERFGDEIAQLVDGVTKLTEITFQSRDERQAENYRKMMVAMATDVRVILIKLADRLHNMRTLGALDKKKQQEKARETLEIFAPLAHRLGIHAIKWELEDLAFATLHPRKYEEIKELVAQQRAERESYVTEAGKFLGKELKDVGIEAEISGRAKHFYSIYTKMTRKGREFNEIFDLTAMRVLVGLGQGLLRRDRDHPLALEAAAGPLQGLHRDAQGQHVPGASHDGDRARGAAAGDPDPHAGDARSGRVRDRRPRDLQGGGRRGRGGRQGEDDLAAPAAREREGGRPQAVPRGAQGRPVRGRGVRVHAQGRGQEPLGRLDPARLRLLDPHRRRPPLRRRQGERQDRAAPLPAAQRRHRRGDDRRSRAAAPRATG